MRNASVHQLFHYQRVPFFGGTAVAAAVALLVLLYFW